MYISQNELDMLNDQRTPPEDLYQRYKEYEYDDGAIPQNKIKGLVFLKEAGVRGHGKALFTLYIKCTNGDVGIEKNPAAAIKLLETSAKAGFYKAAFVLSCKYHKGSPEEGIELDLDKGNAWLKKAAGYKKRKDDGYFYGTMGYPKAQRIVASKHLHGFNGFEKSERIYINLMASASRNGDKSGDIIAQKELFFIVMRGKARRKAIGILGVKKIAEIRTNLAENMAADHPAFRSEFSRVLLTEFREKQGLNRRLPQPN